MDDSGNRCATTIVDISHRTGNGACCGDSTKERRSKVGYSLCDELGVGVMVVTYYTICNSGRKKTLDRSENSYRDSRRYKLLDCLPGHFWNMSLGKFA